MPERKALSVEFKQDGPEGSFKAVFSKFNVVDLDGDVTLPGAFQAGAKARISQYGHNWNNYTIGKGVIDQDQVNCWMDGQFNLKTTAGRDTYESVKDAGDLQEWSYGYDVDDASMDPKELAQWPGAIRILKKLTVHEVSPVMLGAGIGTGTVDIKSRTMTQQYEAAINELSDVQDYVGRNRDLSSLTAKNAQKEGRVLSDVNRSRLRELSDIARSVVSDIEKLLEETDPEKAADVKAARIREMRVKASLGMARVAGHEYTKGTANV